MTSRQPGRARLIDRTQTSGADAWILGVAIALDLGVLAVFKYYGFFVYSFGDGLDTIGLWMPLPLLTI